MATVTLAGLPDHLLSHGLTSFTAADAAQLVGVPVAHVYPGLQRLVDRAQIFSPARGFYVPIPPEFRTWRSVPATHFIDAMMNHLGRRYYVGLLSAAELHGVAHQRPQAFQVMVDRTLAARKAGRVDLRFYHDARLLSAATVPRQTPTGGLILATPATVVFDLTARPDAGGGLDNVATVLAELVAERLVDVAALRAAASRYPASAIRRAGWILQHHSDLDVGGHLDARDAAPTMLDPHGGRRGPIDPTWQLIINTQIQPDT